MDQKWLLIPVILGFCHITSGADRSAREGEKIDINCTPKITAGASMIIWFRVLDNYHMEFIGSFSTTGIKKSLMENFDEIFSYTSNRLTLKSFQKKDSGTYSCTALYQGTKMSFGEATKIKEVETATKTEAPPTCTTIRSVSRTTSCACDKNNEGVSSSYIGCTPIIFGSLAGGCGLLLLLLIVTILYCNRIRTRRCPHHHKRRPRPVPPEKQMMASRYV